MATPSRFNRPYGNSASGQASWEKINRPDRQLGDQSLANQPATASGRGYYDPARILERVARGRPGTTMQQADAARDAYGMGVVNKLLDQNQQRLDQGQGGMGTEAETTPIIPTFTPNQNLLTGYMNQLGGASSQSSTSQAPPQTNPPPQPKISSAPAQTSTPAPTYTNDISTNTPVSTSGGGGGLKSYVDKMAALGSKAVPSAIEAAARQFNEENAFAKDAQGNFVLTPPDKEGNRYEVESPEAIRERLKYTTGSAVERAEIADRLARRIEKLQGWLDDENRGFSDNTGSSREWDDASRKYVGRYDAEYVAKLRDELAKYHAARKAVISGSGEDNYKAINAAYPDILEI